MSGSKTLYYLTYRDAIARARSLAKSSGRKVRISAGRDERKQTEVFYAVTDGLVIGPDAVLVATVDPGGHLEMCGSRYHRMKERQMRNPEQPPSAVTYLVMADGKHVWITDSEKEAVDEGRRLRDHGGGHITVVEMPGQRQVAAFGGMRLPPAKLRDLPRHGVRRNASRRRSGVQSLEDYRQFGTIYKYDEAYWLNHGDVEDEVHWSHLQVSGPRDLIDARDILMPEHMVGGDYSGDSSTRANYTSFMAEFGEVPGVIAIYGSHGSYAVGIRIEAVNEEMVEILEKLQDYPIIDEEKMSEVESEWENEAWENWARSDFRRALTRKFPAREDDIDEFFDNEGEDFDTVWALFEDARERSNTDWRTEHSGMHIDIDRVVAAVDEEDLDAAIVMPRTQ